MQNKVLISALFSPFLRFFDVLFSSLIVGPLVVIYWATTWKLCDVYIRPDDPAESAAISLVIGFIGQLIFIFYQDSIGKVLKFENHKFINLVVSKLYALVSAQTCIHFWRGVWKIVDLLSSVDTASMVINVMQNLVILMFSKTLNIVSAAPFVVTTDQTHGNYAIKTYFKRVKADGDISYLFDCVCTLMMSAVVAFVWRDVWALIDANLFPGESELSAYASIAIGYVFSLIFFAAENAVVFLSQKYNNHRIYIHHAFTIICLLATVNVWRGLWLLLELKAGHSKEALFLLNGVAWKLLMFFNCINSLSSVGIVIDIEETPVNLPIQYFQKLVKKEENNMKILEANVINEISVSTKL